VVRIACSGVRLSGIEVEGPTGEGAAVGEASFAAWEEDPQAIAQGFLFDNLKLVDSLQDLGEKLPSLRQSANHRGLRGEKLLYLHYSILRGRRTKVIASFAMLQSSKTRYRFRYVALFALVGDQRGNIPVACSRVPEAVKLPRVRRPEDANTQPRKLCRVEFPLSRVSESEESNKVWFPAEGI